VSTINNGVIQHISSKDALVGADMIMVHYRSFCCVDINLFVIIPPYMQVSRTCLVYWARSNDYKRIICTIL